MNPLAALQGVFQLPATAAAAWGFAACFALCVLMVITKRWHGALTMDVTDGIQKFHTAPTPRVGGIPIVLAVCVAWWVATADVQDMLFPILLAGGRFKVKRIQVKPKASLSLQKHHHRAEHWIVVTGTAEITNGDKVLMVEQVGSIFIECEYGHLHSPTYADVLMRDPHTLKPIGVGQSGVIQVQSAIPLSYPGHSLLTEDMGTLHGHDDCPCGRAGSHFTVDGRLPQVEIRGCSDTRVMI